MAHLHLPALGLEGDWSPGAAERSLAAQLVTVLPDPLAPNANVVDRWKAVLVALNVLIAVPRDNADLLFQELDPEGRGLQSRAGVFTMVEMPFSVVRTLDETQSFLRNLSQVHGNLDRSVDLLSDLERDLSDLKTRLKEVAAN